MRKKGRAGEIDQILGGQLRAIRIERGITQKDLASQMNITYQQVQKYECGTTRVTVAGLIEIARILDVPIESILDDIAGPRSQNAPSNGSEPSELHEDRATNTADGINRAVIAMARDFAAIEQPNHGKL